MSAVSDKKLRVLMVSGDMPSHPLAVAKLANHLADAGHEITFATPAGNAFHIAEKAVKGNDRISVVAAGHCTTETQLNVHGACDPDSWTHMFEALKNPAPQGFVSIAHMTAPMYDALLDLMTKEPRPDVVVLSHYMYSVAGDAAEKAGIPAVTFYHLPYDPAIFLGELDAWRYPKMIPTFPHVASYPTIAPGGFKGYLQMAWKWVDAQISAFNQCRAARQLSALRLSRKLQPSKAADFAGYWATHPTIALGGPPFGPPAPVPPLVALVGQVEVEKQKDMNEDLEAWLEESGLQGIVFVSMGTGQTLTEAEVREIAGGLGRNLAGQGGPRLLWALRASDQERFHEALRDELGTSIVMADGSSSFLSNKVRIASFVPQVQVLKSGHVSLFLSHMGFGAMTEGVAGGCVFLSYPGGFDQVYNAKCAEEGGFAVRLPLGLLGLEGIARDALQDPKLKEQALRAQRQLALAGGPKAAVEAVEKFAAMGRAGANALVLPFARKETFSFSASMAALALGAAVAIALSC